MRSPIAREGVPIIAAFVAGAALLTWVWVPLLLPGGILALWCIWFFRDPDRVPDAAVAADPGLLISPADGRIEMIAPMVPPAGLELGVDPRTRISVFMNVFNVHVNRAPLAGRVGAVVYVPGKFLHAASDKASDDNERLALRLDLPDGRRLAVVQIAGLLARRIVCRVGVGADLARGDRFGLIRFGSRVDVYLPEGMVPTVPVGARVTAGRSVLARPLAPPPHRQAALRTGEGK